MCHEPAIGVNSKKIVYKLTKLDFFVSIPDFKRPGRKEIPLHPIIDCCIDAEIARNDIIYYSSA